MKFTTLTTLVTLVTTALLTTALLTTAKADIWIYEGTDLGSGGEVLWLFFPGFPPPHSCEDVKNTRLILQKWDVSEIEGVVCDGDGCYNGNPEDLERLEFDVDFGHFTIYKNRDWNLVGFER
ncbi:hypothetical protein QC761_603605 [Podospora bellae-mahoneyi]|uniref:Uncharacterized protein n=1 Tax=Podospora bellae-mahoneyi TaxID=2093777 RepID=A0ABR0F9I6_9PEZI|nr:hypothetical protein QC761_603605 [Podospora bellae-mahoneyi]